MIYISIQFIAGIILFYGLHKVLNRFLETDESIILPKFLLAGFFIICISAIINFFFSLNYLVYIIVVAGGVVIYICYEINNFKFDFLYKKITIYAVFVFLLLIFINGPITHYDTGLYHMQMVKWIEESSLPKGLANLHGRFGFNSWWAVFAAIFKPIGLKLAYPVYFANGLLVFFWFASLYRVWKKIKTEQTVSIPLLFFGLTGVVLLVYGLKNVPSLSTDMPTAFLGLYAYYLMMELLLNIEADRASIFVVLVISVVLAITIKLSMIFYLLLVLAALLYVWKKDGISKKMWISLAIGLLVAGVYLLRGAWLSGMPLYPSTIFAQVNLPWAVSMEQASREAVNVLGWARSPGNQVAAMDGFWWVKDWLFMNWKHFVPLGLTYAAFLCSWLISLNKRQRKWNKEVAFLFLVMVGGIAFWFFTAPDPRFGIAYLYAPAFLLGAISLYRVFRERSGSLKLRLLPMKGKIVVGLTMVVFFGAVLYFGNWTVNKIEYVEGKWFDYTKPLTIQEKKTNYGDIIYVPANGDQSWNAPLPSTPYFDPELKILRDEQGNVVQFRKSKNKE